MTELAATKTASGAPLTPLSRSFVIGMLVTFCVVLLMFPVLIYLSNYDLHMILFYIGLLVLFMLVLWYYKPKNYWIIYFKLINFS